MINNSIPTQQLNSIFAVTLKHNLSKPFCPSKAADLKKCPTFQLQPYLPKPFFTAKPTTQFLLASLITPSAAIEPSSPLLFPSTLTLTQSSKRDQITHLGRVYIHFITTRQPFLHKLHNRTIRI
ncbi:hypothetical protein ACOSQ2_017161 [Xanthoceras sorbifolium]